VGEGDRRGMKVEKKKEEERARNRTKERTEAAEEAEAAPLLLWCVPDW
jgi:hypothetical protein